MDYKKILIIIFLFYFPVSVFSDEIHFKGEMLCKIKTNYIAAVSDGVTKEASHFNNEYKVGDELILDYKYLTFVFNASHNLTAEKFNFQLNDYENDISIMTSDFSDSLLFAYDTDRDIYEFSGIRGVSQTPYYDEDKNYIEKMFDYHQDVYSIVSKDKLLLKDLYQNHILELHRYFKNDWNGILTKYFDDKLGAQITTLNCINKSVALDEIIDKFRKHLHSEILKKQ